MTVKVQGQMVVKIESQGHGSISFQRTAAQHMRCNDTKRKNTDTNTSVITQYSYRRTSIVKYAQPITYSQIGTNNKHGHICIIVPSVHITIVHKCTLVHI